MLVSSRPRLGLILFLGILGTFLMNAGQGFGLTSELKGQLSGFTSETRNQGTWQNTTGLRYIPQLTLTHPLSGSSFLGTEISLNSLLRYDSLESEGDLNVNLYRLKLRLATAQTETRIGLQKINFGPAYLLRPLQWFDRVVPSDPLGLTKGIYGLRFKYSALNNASYWLWGLVGNDEPKGLESLASVSDVPEYGGRLEYPIPSGELAVTFHRRRVNGDAIQLPDFTENRYALDGRFDVGVGLWLESVAIQQKSNLLPFEWTKMLTLGLDYTFDVGHGLYFLIEHLTTVSSTSLFKWDEDSQITAFSLSYPIGLLDTLSLIGYYSWDFDKHFLNLTWRRTYDSVVFNVTLFHSPQAPANAPAFETNSFSAGYGARIMIIYNH
ncbi:MAG: hypothetical protein JRI95_00940 [Deltaproteobacteria bacterium]|nr:hypothetical protein [Deltaproteobacteria bacterium]